jgi:membrane protein DedA with SNARE-associated domain/pimeloyl-ACP methyl ester carboxylesterase
MSRTYSRLLALLLLLYGLSFTVRIFFPVEQKPFKFEEKQSMQWEGQQLSISFLEFGKDSDRPPVVLIPDPFTQEQNFERFSNQIASDRKVFIPIFPSRNEDGSLISHSPEARANMLAKFLRDNEITNFDLAGHGFGNSVAIRLLNIIPAEHVRSYAMLSAIGVQEFHFLGYHVLNQPIYSILYPIGWFLDHGLPVANWNRYIPIDLAGARFMNAMDQRPYRTVLSEVSLPVHILHSTQDRQISVNTAREHHRIIPQSSIKVTEGDHSAIHNHASEWAASYRLFLADVENEATPAQQTVSQERITLAERDFNLRDVPPVDDWAFYMVLLLLTVVTLISEDLGCIGAGLLAAGNVITLFAAFMIVFVGILIADSGIYWIGRLFGRPVIQRAPFKWLITKKDIDWTAMLFKNNGFKIMWGSRFLPGTRFPTYFSAGVLHTPFPTFFLYFFTSILIWTPLVMGVSILVGQQMISYLQIYQEYAIHIFIILVLVIYLGFKLLVPLSTRKGRKELAVYFIRLKQRAFGD